MRMRCSIESRTKKDVKRHDLLSFAINLSDKYSEKVN